MYRARTLLSDHTQSADSISHHDQEGVETLQEQVLQMKSQSKLQGFVKWELLVGHFFIVNDATLFRLRTTTNDSVFLFVCLFVCLFVGCSFLFVNLFCFVLFCF
jgi:hypothetical protein